MYQGQEFELEKKKVIELKEQCKITKQLHNRLKYALS